MHKGGCFLSKDVWARADTTTSRPRAGRPEKHVAGGSSIASDVSGTLDNTHSRHKCMLPSLLKDEQDDTEL